MLTRKGSALSIKEGSSPIKNASTFFFVIFIDMLIYGVVQTQDWFELLVSSYLETLTNAQFKRIHDSNLTDTETGLHA